MAEICALGVRAAIDHTCTPGTPHALSTCRELHDVAGRVVHDGLQFIAAECQLTFRWTTVPVCDSLA